MSETSSNSEKPQPATSPNLIVSLVLGILGCFFAFGGIRVLGFLLGVAALVTAIVGLVRNEPQRVCGFLGILAAVICLF